MHVVAAALTVALAAQPGTVFTFHSNEFWLNLHKFLYVLGRAENKTADATREPVAGAPAESEQKLATLNAVDRSTGGRDRCARIKVAIRRATEARAARRPPRRRRRPPAWKAWTSTTFAACSNTRRRYRKAWWIRILRDQSRVGKWDGKLVAAHGGLCCGSYRYMDIRGHPQAIRAPSPGLVGWC